MLELTVSEILEESRKVKNSAGNLPVRYLPVEVVRKAKGVVEKGDFLGAAGYIKNAFYVFRRTVNRYLLAPHYAVDGAYEWPVPSKFSWGDLKIVNAVGEFLEGEIPRKNDNVKVEVREGEWVNQKEVDPLTGFMKESSREFVSGKDDFEEVFKYRIEDISRVGYVFSNDWQNSSLRKYVCPLSRFITNHSRGEISEQKGSWMMTNFLKNIAREYIN